MLRGRFRRPSHTTIVAYLGLFVALGGTSAYAANEWTGSNVVDGSLTGQDVFDNTISGKGHHQQLRGRRGSERRLRERSRRRRLQHQRQ